MDYLDDTSQPINIMFNTIHAVAYVVFFRNLNVFASADVGIARTFVAHSHSLNILYVLSFPGKRH